MNILVTTGIFPPDVGGPAKFVPLIAEKLSEKYNLKVITFKLFSSDSLSAIKGTNLAGPPTSGGKIPVVTRIFTV